MEDVKTAQNTLSERLSALEAAIQADPVKAVSLPLMKKDIEALQDKTKADSEALRAEVARVYTLIQWFIGLMFTIAIGLFGLALGNILKSERRTERNNPPNDTTLPERPEVRELK